MEGIRDNEFDQDAYHRLNAVCLRAKCFGWTPELMTAAANLNLHLGNWKESMRHALELKEWGRSQLDPEVGLRLIGEADALYEAAEALEHLPNRTKKEWPT